MSAAGSEAGGQARIGRAQSRMRVRDVVAEGLYIAAGAVRLELKNRILVETIAGGEPFDVAHFLPHARDTLLALADEAQEEADRVRHEQRLAWRRFDESDGTHDYRSRDVRNLRRRRKQSLSTAKALRERAADEDALRELVEAAREAAWEEVARNIDSTLRIEAARPDLEPDYDAMRDARMQALMLVDLPRLQSQQRRRSHVAAGEPLPETEAREVVTGTATTDASPTDSTSRYADAARARGIDAAELE